MFCSRIPSNFHEVVAIPYVSFSEVAVPMLVSFEKKNNRNKDLLEDMLIDMGILLLLDPLH